MYNLKNLLPIKVTAKKTFNPNFESIAFYGDRTVATDTYRLLEVSATGESHDAKIIPANQIKTTKLDKKIIKFDLKHIEAIANTPANPHTEYPNVDLVLKEDESIEYATIKVNGEMFGELLLAMSKMNNFKEVKIKVPINQTYKPIHVYASDNNPNQSQRQTAHGLMMPMNR